MYQLYFYICRNKNKVAGPNWGPKGFCTTKSALCWKSQHCFHKADVIMKAQDKTSLYWQVKPGICIQPWYLKQWIACSSEFEVSSIVPVTLSFFIHESQWMNQRIKTSFFFHSFLPEVTGSLLVLPAMGSVPSANM